MPRSVMLPRFSSCPKLASAKATRFTNCVWNDGSSSRTRDFQNFPTNAARSASVAAAAQPDFSVGVISQTTGPSPHAALAVERSAPELAGGLNSAYAREIDGPCDAMDFWAAWNAATA